MHTKKTLLGAAVLIVGVTGFTLSSDAESGACKTVTDKAAQVYQQATKDHCADLNTEPNLDNNPYIYTNPDASECSSFLSMPGLADYNIGGKTACSLVTAATGKVASMVTKEISKQADMAVGKINQQSQEKLGMSTNQAISLGQDAINGYNQSKQSGGSPAILPSQAPGYNSGNTPSYTPGFTPGFNSGFNK